MSKALSKIECRALAAYYGNQSGAKMPPLDVSSLVIDGKEYVVLGKDGLTEAVYRVRHVEGKTMLKHLKRHQFAGEVPHV